MQLSDKLDVTPLRFQCEAVTWYRPTSLDQLLGLMNKNPGARLIGGGTEIGLLVSRSMEWFLKYILMLTLKLIYVAINHIILNDITIDYTYLD